MNIGLEQTFINNRISANAEVKQWLAIAANFGIDCVTRIIEKVTSEIVRLCIMTAYLVLRFRIERLCYIASESGYDAQKDEKSLEGTGHKT